jgi:ABC-type transport system involved in multi-copper enzyme maturation permease subunit
LKHLIWLSIVSGYRSNSFKILLSLLLVSVWLAWLAAGFSARSPDTLMLDTGLSLQRIVLTLMAVFWVQELYYKDLERKAAIFLLAYPISRATYLLARFVGVWMLVTSAVIVSALLLYLLMLAGSGEYVQSQPVNMGYSYSITWAYFWLDVTLVAAFAFMLCSVSETPNLPLLCSIAFSITMHAMGPILEYLRYGSDVKEEHRQWIQPIIEDVIYLLPDLDRLDLRAWTLYGSMPPAELMFWGAAIAVSYISLFISLSIIGLNRREIV